ncbi:MAG TPA: hypothetical protein VLT32_03275 [Candidatus Sulfomarinibacteraceae bacterium]|nr:hypothetical protein [Candidatus Sulfomarinibacteraceae bacterium]
MTDRARHGWTIAGSVVLALAVAAGAGAQSPHAGLTYTGPEMCLTCHETEALEVHGSVMYQWQGDAPDMATGPPVQGKISGGVNSYCINILGNWNACGSCHVGLGALPEATASPQQLANIDCLICHQEQYRRVKVNGVFVPDTAAMAITMDEAVQTVHLPRRSNCLQCHAKAGGGDAVKRGDLALAHVATSDSSYDVHMATTGADLVCQDCHVTTNHRVAGRGSDLRPTDSAVEIDCTNCHVDMNANHPSTTIRRHLDRVACQSCHIPVYAKNASDTPATEATETHRTWLASHSPAPPYHPAPNKDNNLIPVYRFWNGSSHNALLYDVAHTDPVTGRYPTSRPLGHASNPAAKLYPFKYKTAEQPITNDTGQLIALDTSVFFATADAAAATEAGLVNMGLSPSTPYSWVETDTLQVLNHQVSPEDNALACADCHGSSARLDLPAEHGYKMWGSQTQVCRQCHGPEDMPSFESLHNEHVSQEGFDCSWCHSFSRPERSLSLPSNGVLFRDGLETGNTYAWSDAEPR